MRTEVKEALNQGTGAIPRTKDVLFANQTIRLYSVGWLSFMSLLATVTIRLWERKKILPKPFFQLAGGSRWYCAAELIIYSSLIQKHYQSGRDLKKLKIQLEEASHKIRTQYLGMEKSRQPIKELLSLANESAIEKAFRPAKVEKKLSKEHFHEVQKLITG